MAQLLPLKDLVAGKPYVLVYRRDNEQDEWEISKCPTWPPLGYNPPKAEHEEDDENPFSKFISPEPDSTTTPEQLESARAGSSERPKVQRSKSLSPVDHFAQSRYSPAHSPTSSPARKIKRWMRKMEQQCHNCPVLRPKIVEIAPKQSTDRESESDVTESDLVSGIAESLDEAIAGPSPSSLLDQDIPEIVIVPPAQDETPPSQVTSSARGRPVQRAGSTVRAKARRRSWQAPSYELETIPEEPLEDLVGLGIANA